MRKVIAVVDITYSSVQAYLEHLVEYFKENDVPYHADRDVDTHNIVRLVKNKEVEYLPRPIQVHRAIESLEGIHLDGTAYVGELGSFLQRIKFSMLARHGKELFPDTTKFLGDIKK